MKYESEKNKKYRKLKKFDAELFDVDGHDLSELWDFSWGEGCGDESFLLCSRYKNVFKIVPQMPQMHNLLVDNFNGIEFLLLKYRTGMDTVVYTRLIQMRNEIEDLLDKCKYGNYCLPCEKISIVYASKA